MKPGAPAGVESLIARAESLAASSAPAGPLELLIAVLEHERERVATAPVEAAAGAMADAAIGRSLTGRWPLLDLHAGLDVMTEESDAVVDRIAGRAPAPLADAGTQFRSASDLERRGAVAGWLDDPTLFEPRLDFWFRGGAGCVLRAAARRVEAPPRQAWSKGTCPLCGGPPQVAVIAERSGEFMAGSPRRLVCARCYCSWAFARAVCPACGEEDSRKLTTYTDENRPVARIDVCETCRSYLKTFDLRQPGGTEVVALVDDVALVALDIWAHEQGFARSSPSFAGV